MQKLIKLQNSELSRQVINWTPSDKCALFLGQRLGPSHHSPPDHACRNLVSTASFSSLYANVPDSEGIEQGYLLKDKIRHCKLLTWYVFEQLHEPIHIYNFFPDLGGKRMLRSHAAQRKEGLEKSLSSKLGGTSPSTNICMAKTAVLNPNDGWRI